VGILEVDDILDIWSYCFSSKGLIRMKRKDGKERRGKGVEVVSAKIVAFG
jgi:hypothetical protein